MTVTPSAPPRVSAPKRDLNGTIIGIWGGSDLRLTVLGRRETYPSRRATVRKPALPIDESGVFCERAELRYRLQ